MLNDPGARQGVNLSGYGRSEPNPGVYEIRGYPLILKSADGGREEKSICASRASWQSDAGRPNPPHSDNRGQELLAERGLFEGTLF